MSDYIRYYSFSPAIGQRFSTVHFSIMHPPFPGSVSLDANRESLPSILCGPMRYNVVETKGGSGMTDFFTTLSPAEKGTGRSLPEKTVRLIAERCGCDERVGLSAR